MRIDTTIQDFVIVTGSNGLIGYPVAARLSQTFAVVGSGRCKPLAA